MALDQTRSQSGNAKVNEWKKGQNACLRLSAMLGHLSKPCNDYSGTRPIYTALYEDTMSARLGHVRCCKSMPSTRHVIDPNTKIREELWEVFKTLELREVSKTSALAPAEKEDVKIGVSMLKRSPAKIPRTDSDTGGVGGASGGVGGASGGTGSGHGGRAGRVDRASGASGGGASGGDGGASRGASGGASGHEVTVQPAEIVPTIVSLDSGINIEVQPGVLRPKAVF